MTAATDDNIEPDYTLAETAAVLKVSTRWVRDRIKAGKDPADPAPFVAHTRRGHKIMFTPDQLAALRAVDAQEPPVAESITTGRKRGAK